MPSNVRHNHDKIIVVPAAIPLGRILLSGPRDAAAGPTDDDDNMSEVPMNQVRTSDPGYDVDLPRHLERTLAEFLHWAGGPIRRTEPAFGPAVDALTDFVLGGGKRLRPTFAWWAWRGTGGAATGADAAGVLHPYLGT